jgi:hypothetical protein
MVLIWSIPAVEVKHSAVMTAGSLPFGLDGRVACSAILCTLMDMRQSAD